jgi:hypothetical protein
MTMKDFVLGVFSDGGAPSFSRVATGVVVGFACGWVTAIVRVTHVLPDFQEGLSKPMVKVSLDHNPALLPDVIPDLVIALLACT